MDPDQAAPLGSSLIGVHSFCIHEEKNLACSALEADVKSRQHFQKICGRLKVNEYSHVCMMCRNNKKQYMYFGYYELSKPYCHYYYHI